MRKLLLLLFLAGLAAAGWYGWQRFSAQSGPRACAKLADRCKVNDDVAQACERVIAEVNDSAGAEDAQKLIKCINDSVACADAAGCAAGLGIGALSRTVLEFLDGMRRARGY